MVAMVILHVANETDGDAIVYDNDIPYLQYSGVGIHCLIIYLIK